MEQIIGWVGTIILLIGLVLVGKKKREGFLLMATGEIIWAIRGYLNMEIDLVVACAIFSTICFFDFKNWSKK